MDIASRQLEKFQWRYFRRNLRKHLKICWELIFIVCINVDIIHCMLKLEAMIQVQTNVVEYNSVYLYDNINGRHFCFESFWERGSRLSETLRENNFCKVETIAPSSRHGDY